MVTFSRHVGTTGGIAGNVRALRDWADAVLPLVLGVAGPFEPFDRRGYDEFQGYAGPGDLYEDRASGERYRLGAPTAGVSVDEFVEYRVSGLEENTPDKRHVLGRGAWLGSDPLAGGARFSVRVSDGGMLFEWALDESLHAAVLAATERVLAGREYRGEA